jgi:uncharacterized membrane protein
MNRYLAIGLATAAGAALFEVALVPAVVIGGAAMLAPNYLPRLRRQVQPAIDAITRPLARPKRKPKPKMATSAPVLAAAELLLPVANSLPALLPRFAIKRSLAKTVTFRVIVTGLDFTSNYVVLGEFAVAAGLSGFALVAGPVFYFAHETAWNYFGPSGGAVDVALPSRRVEAGETRGERRGFTISRALAKTVTYRTVATVVDFTTMYVVVGDLATALGLTAFGFVLGPFVYLGHEMAWDRLSPPQEPANDEAAPTEVGAMIGSGAGATPTFAAAG